MFSDGATFPKASTMLEATTDASNKNATDISIRQYKEKMDEIAGASCTGYLKREECEKSSRDCSSRALASFDEVATFGNEKKIKKTKEKLRRDIQELEEMYQKFNSSRNPFEGMETYVVMPSCYVNMLTIYRSKMFTQDNGSFCYWCCQLHPA